MGNILTFFWGGATGSFLQGWGFPKGRNFRPEGSFSAEILLRGRKGGFPFFEKAVRN